MVHGGEGAAVRVSHDTKHVEVVTQFIGRHQQVPTRVELQCADGFRRVRRKVRNKLVTVRILVDTDFRG